MELGFSPCPNDTFMFHAWAAGEIPGAPPVAPWLADIEELNLRALGDDPLPMTKISAALAARLSDRYALCAAGAALGRGVGPLVVVRDARTELGGLESLSGMRVAIPGRGTTAALLFEKFGPDVELVEQRFDRIMPAVAHGGCDAGVVIHESRFTYRDHGLRAIADLGEVWEGATDLPLPLGVIAIHKDAPDPKTLEAAMRASVERAFADPLRSRAYVRQHAQEMDDEVCTQHIELYVNEWSVDVGVDGRRAVAELVGDGVQWV